MEVFPYKSNRKGPCRDHSNRLCCKLST